MRHGSRPGRFKGVSNRYPRWRGTVADTFGPAAMKRCPCGYRSDPRRACPCTPPQGENYLSKISGPLLDRIDLHVEVPAVPFTQLAELPPGPPSSDFRAQVLAARERQTKRFGHKGPLVNGRMTPRQLRKLCVLKPETMSILKAAMEELGLSAGPTTKCWAWPAPSPIWKALTRSNPSTSPRRWATARSIGACGCRLHAPYF